jgi:murein DD-endopeptidase MepM/ murein hydrolase activator NlpD
MTVKSLTLLNRILCSAEALRAKAEKNKKKAKKAVSVPLPPGMSSDRLMTWPSYHSLITEYIGTKANPKASLISYLCRYFKYTVKEAQSLIHLSNAPYIPYPTGMSTIDDSIVVTAVTIAYKHYWNPTRYDYLGREIITPQAQNAIDNGASKVPIASITPPDNTVFKSMIFSEDNRIEVEFGLFGYQRTKGVHKGQDISTLGDPTIHSTVDGIVIFAGIWSGDDRDEWGACVIIKDSADYYHLFAHCEENSIMMVKVGKKVNAGQAIAIMGESGNAGPGSGQGRHVHYEIRTGVSLTVAPNGMGQMIGGGTSHSPEAWSGVPNAFESSGITNTQGRVVNSLSWYDPR